MPPSGRMTRGTYNLTNSRRLISRPRLPRTSGPAKQLNGIWGGKKEHQVRNAARRNVHHRAVDEASHQKGHQRAKEYPRHAKVSFRVQGPQSLDGEKPEDSPVLP